MKQIDKLRDIDSLAKFIVNIINSYDTCEDCVCTKCCTGDCLESMKLYLIQEVEE